MEGAGAQTISLTKIQEFNPDQAVSLAVTSILDLKQSHSNNVANAGA
jgi:hypothetical protein